MENYLSNRDYKEIEEGIDITLIENKSFLITGASGFLARNIIGFLLYLKNNNFVPCRIIAVSHDINKSRRIYAREINDASLELFEWKYCEKLNVSSDVDFIFHTSSPATTAYFLSHPAETLQVNAIGTWRVLEFCKDKKVSGMLFFSSGAIHGDIVEAPSEIKEEDIYILNFLEEKNSYAEAKRYGEALCKAYFVQYKTHAKIARISHTYGPGIDINDGRVFSDFVNDIINYRDLNIKGDGSDFRPFLYIADAIKAFFFILFYGEDGVPYTVANTYQIFTVKELADILVTDGFPERHLSVVGDNICKDKKRKYLLNTDRLQSLGWKPKIDVVEGFKRTVESFEDSRRN